MLDGPTTFVRSIAYLRHATPEKIEELWEDQMLVGCSLRDLVWAYHHHPKRLEGATGIALEDIEAVIRDASNSMPTYDMVGYSGVANKDTDSHALVGRTS